jgi:DNA polymerase-3 subunit alpha
VLAASRPLLEAGKSLIITASAEWDGDELKLRAASILDLDQAAAQAGEGMVIRLSDASSLAALSAELSQAGKGLVNIVVPGNAGEEVEIELKKRIAVNATLRNRIAALPGIASVEAV